MKSSRLLLLLILIFLGILSIIFGQYKYLHSSVLQNASGLIYISSGLQHDPNFYQWVYTDDDQYRAVSPEAFQDYQQSEVWASEAYRVNPSRSALQLIALSLLAQRQPDKAVDLINPEDLPNKKDDYLRFWNGVIYEKSGDLEKAVKEWSDIGYSRHMIFRVRYYQNAGMDDRAITYSNALIEICDLGNCSKSDVGDIWGNLGALHRNAGNHVKAAVAYQKAVELNPLPQYQEGLALSLWNAGKRQAAVEILESLVRGSKRESPSLISYYIWLGKLYEELGDIKKAEQRMAKGIELVESPSSDWQFQEAAWFYARRKDFIKVDEIMTRAVSELPEKVCQSLQYWERLISEAGQVSEIYNQAASLYQSQCSSNSEP